MKKKTKKEESYRLTFKGLCSIEFLHEEKTQQFLDSLELWLRRNNCNAVILQDDGVFDIHKVYVERK